MELYPENATIKNVFWTSSNNDIAWVDKNGNVTVLKDGSNSDNTCKIIASTMYKNVTYEFTLNIDNAGVDVVTIDDSDRNAIDFSLPYEVYSLDGKMIGGNIDNLGTGIFILHQGHKTRKLIK